MPAGADEGVWTFDSPPAKALQSGYGFTPSADWLDALRLSAVRLVGLIFDGNLEGLGGRYAYMDRKARAIAVDGRAMVEALTKVYGAIPLAAEFSGR